MSGWMVSALLVSALIALSYADVYMQNPRGSNNRLKGRGRDRQNARRMFDSQDNARGGYNVGGLSYYEGSKLAIEWTNQHQCGRTDKNGRNNGGCELVIQYMCSDKLRNGISEKTIPQKLTDCEKDDCNNDWEYGMHEDHDYYEHCFTRKRNHGLYTADQDMNNRATARFTRQDNGGTRYAYECPEERDYYPYSGPTPWKDIVVMTGDTSRCQYYKENSQNVADKPHCVSNVHELPVDVRSDTGKIDRHFRKYPVPQTEEECKDYASTLTVNGETFEISAKWVVVKAHGINPPDCIESPYSRDNHLGNGIGGFPNTYNWTIPADYHEQCALRIRYNISTGEFPWDTDFSANGRNRNNQPCKACAINLAKQVGLTDEWEAQDRGYILTGNPEVLPMSVEGEVLEKFELKLAVDTDQYGRTFQARSHMFAIKKKPSEPQCEEIINVNVKGKRGNIVQTYPAHEYDFTPNRLTANVGDCVHIQWTGSDDNPNNNAGQGEAGSDRSNIILLDDAKYPFVQQAKADKPNKYGHWGNSYPKNISESTFLGLSKDDAVLLAMAGPHTGGDIEQLDENGPSFNLGLRKLEKVGVFRYLSTRNNAFTNRGQKGVFIVKPKGSSDQESFNDEALNNVEAEMMKDMRN